MATVTITGQMTGMYASKMKPKLKIQK